MMWEYRLYYNTGEQVGCIIQPYLMARAKDLRMGRMKSNWKQELK